MSGGEWLMLIFGPTLMAARVAGPPPSTFVIPETGERFREDKRYADQGIPGFYDWRRTASGTVIGVCFSPLDEFAFILDRLRGYSYVYVCEHFCFEMLFREGDWEVEKSVDQAFGSNHLFDGDRGSLALTFEPYFMSENELSDLWTAPIPWVTIRAEP